jgi:N-acetylglucosaminyldiphosphoundecaprenol N-acetyl-beta-D-mannosaminyltransferase
MKAIESQFRMKVNKTDKINILGFGISRISIQETIEQIGKYIAGGGYHYVLASNVHTVMMSQHDSDYRRISNEADIALPDGKPLVWAAELLEKTRLRRICGRDLMSSLCKESLKTGHSHYFLGGRETVLRILVNRLETKYPGLNIAGYYSPPFRPLTNEEDARVIQMINDSKADIVWVGLGAPKQELWIGEHLGKIESPVMAAVGAAFDYHAGNVSQAPQWMQKSGLEWLFRFCIEPHRLWRRYLLNNPRFIYLLLCQVLHIRKFPISER